jgi:16S rRNA (adenine(1408)-N(1))-methyltransferase
VLTVVTGKKISTLTRDQLDARIAPYAEVLVDLGAGDGRSAYVHAREHAEHFVVAIDPVQENLREFSAKAARKVERGGAPNVIYIVASIEQLPAELDTIGHEVRITLPWGSLMRGILLGDALVLGNIARLTRAGARVRITLNTRIFDDPVPVDVRDLPEPTPEYAEEALATAFARAALRLDVARWMAPEEVAALGTTWAKRLSHRAPPRSLYLEAVKNRGAGS